MSEHKSIAVPQYITHTTDHGIFTARREGVIAKISIPATTNCDWGLKTEFLDLPAMDKDEFNNLIDALMILRDKIGKGES